MLIILFLDFKVLGRQNCNTNICNAFNGLQGISTKSPCCIPERQLRSVPLLHPGGQGLWGKISNVAG